MPKVAIVGSGPSGLFLSKNLIKLFKSDIQIDIFEKLSEPLGLLKFGVAPDHPDVKKKFMTHFEPIFDSKNVNIFLNAVIGTKPKILELRKHYDALVMCTGMSDSKRNWAGVNNCYGADQIFGWYNRNPLVPYFERDLSKMNNLLIIGNGNVALDMARIFSKTPSQLAADSLDPAVLRVLSKSNINEITILGRRDITKASFTPAELREFKMFCDSCKIETVPELKEFDNQNLTRIQTKNVQIMKDLVNNSTKSSYGKRINFKFSAAAVELSRDKENGIAKIKNSFDSSFENLKFDLIIECTGFKQNQIFDGIKQDENGKIITSDLFRIESNIYACGWSRSGPKGNIADSMDEAYNCAVSIYEDLSRTPSTHLRSLSGLDTSIFKHRFSK